jgi:hypothetical protein
MNDLELGANGGCQSINQSRPTGNIPAIYSKRFKISLGVDLDHAHGIAHYNRNIEGFVGRIQLCQHNRQQAGQGGQAGQEVGPKQR